MGWVAVADDCTEEAISGVFPQKPQYQYVMLSLKVMGQCHPGKRLLLEVWILHCTLALPCCVALGSA